MKYEHKHRSRSPIDRRRSRSRRSRSNSPKRRYKTTYHRSRSRSNPRRLQHQENSRYHRKQSHSSSYLNEDEKGMKWGKQETERDMNKNEVKQVEKPNFGLSGALAMDKQTGNIENGIVKKWSEPPEARVPKKRYRLYVFKGEDVIATIHIHRKSAFLVGRDKTIADILTEHQSCSKQHAVIQFRQYEHISKDGLNRELQIRPYLMDLNSTNGTILNGEVIDAARYIELREKDVIKFGESTREYVLMDST